MNHAELETLAILLDKQLALQNKLLVMEQYKTKVLVQGDTAKLSELMTQAQAVILSSAGLEKQRQLLLQKIDWGQHSMRKIAEEYDPQDRYMLKEKLQHLADVLRQLKKTSDRNKNILQSRLSVINQCLSLVGLQESAHTYNAEGHF